MILAIDLSKALASRMKDFVVGVDITVPIFISYKYYLVI